MAACSGGSTSQMLPSNGQSAMPESMHPAGAHPYVPVCGRAPAGFSRCLALVRTDVGGAPNGYHGLFPDKKGHTTPSGYGPATLDKAYNLNTSGGSGQTVALVEVGDYPSAQADLNTYRSQYGLSACGSGCFKKVSQTGSTKLPRENAGWAQESALDMDMVSAVCPNCHILMVEANSASNSNLAAAVNEAAKLGATEISNSYGGAESGSSNSAYSHSGIVITASAGDDGYYDGTSGPSAEQPCTYASVVCTGGSSLATASNTRGFTETVWNDLASGNGATGSGCSKYVAKPSWQTDKGCTKRSETDVSWDGDPLTGVAVYDSTSYGGYSGWMVFGGTSVAAPAIAAVYALAGNGSSLGPNAAQGFWANSGAGLNAVTSGNNIGSGQSCATAIKYICTAGTGTDGNYSGPTGWGTPNGSSAF
ncbi:MAG: peptidase S8 [Candidatus Eremiobacteraeota bacterium]|nr:peptidase S8 [Candidatus Eremiobacteraeota bacterium]